MNATQCASSKSSAECRPPELLGRKLTVLEAAAYLTVSKSFLDKKRLNGSGPPFLKLGRRVVYDGTDLENWAVSNRRSYTT